MAHPYLFTTGKFGYKMKRDIPISPSKYFNQTLLNYLEKFAPDSDYIFFVHSIIQKTHLNNQISIALRKDSSNGLIVECSAKTSRQLFNNLLHKIKHAAS